MQAFEYVENRLHELATKFKNQEPPKKRCGWNRILVELDGCQIRTGINAPTETQKLTPLRQIKKCKRQVDWREVRVGLARPVSHPQQCNQYMPNRYKLRSRRGKFNGKAFNARTSFALPGIKANSTGIPLLVVNN